MRALLSVTGTTVMALALSLTTLSAQSGQADKAKSTTDDSVQAKTAFSVLKDVTAVPMAARELATVKGQHAHFWNAGAPFPGPPHVVNGNNTDHWSDLYGDGLVGPGYHGLCRAAANSPAIFINPGGGCGF